MNKEEALLELTTEYAFNIIINMNDTFHYACADASELSSDDVEDMIPYIQEYGFNALIAYEAIKRGYNPDVVHDGLFYKVKTELVEKMEQDENFLPDLNTDKRRESEEIKRFGGILSYKFVNPSVIEKLKGQKYQTCICSVDGLKGKYETRATCMRDARKKLEEIISE